MKKMEKSITAIVCGAGNRGRDAYGRYAEKYSDKIKIIGVAEPNPTRLENFANIHKIPENRRYNSWENILAEDKFADAAIITTQDNMHTQPALLAMERGYDVLLEKPMANKLNECIQLVKKAQETGKHLQICHVLRYTDFYSTIYNIIQSGKLGKLINIECKENVSYWHYSHSYIRGNWRNSEESSPMILAKCCHDLDLLYWMVGVPPKKINSFGNLLFYKKENAPEGAPKRCLDGCPHANNCIYYAPFIYIYNIPLLRIGLNSDIKTYKIFAWLAINHRTTIKILSKIIPLLKKVVNWEDWPVSVITDDLTYEGKMKALREGPYGRCVYHCDNNVVDHQIVNIEFENGVTANLTVHGHSALEGRSIRIDGTKASLIGEFLHSGEKIWFYDKLSGKKEKIFEGYLQLSGHGGGDTGLMNAFIDLMRKNILKPLTNALASLESHIMAFAAEKSRLDGNVIDMEKYRQEVMNL
jgi:predicted dehydrogenase